MNWKKADFDRWKTFSTEEDYKNRMTKDSFRKSRIYHDKGTTLIVKGNAVYELDKECLKKGIHHG